jgi:hypothetical protein
MAAVGRFVLFKNRRFALASFRWHSLPTACQLFSSMKIKPVDIITVCLILTFALLKLNHIDTVSDAIIAAIIAYYYTRRHYNSSP